MAYQVLARKWRPQDFSEVVGQKPVVTALQNAISENRIAHAYLFSGIRGVGKTSVARILAKGLNCENGPAAEPCNDCDTCREITAGGDFDVIEHDAATYSKVEQVRELTESLKYRPARDRYKVVILDEIHRLSRQAFDALLKIVEEPPDHLVFIFATTEAEAVPATVLSRCQEFRFRRVGLDELAAYLERIAEKENIEVGAAALRIIARAGDGSVRDSVALLDQLATFGSGAIQDGDAASLLGGLDRAVFRQVLTAIGEGDRGALALVIRQIEEDGWDPRFVFAEFLDYCRMALHLSLGAGSERLEATQEEAQALALLAEDLGYEQILRVLNLLLQSEESIRRSESAALALEIAWLRAAELPKLVAIEDLISGSAPPSSGETKPRVRKRAAAPKTPGKRTRPPAAPHQEKPAAKPEPASPRREARSQPPTAHVEAPEKGSAAAPESSVDAFLLAVGRTHQALAAHLAGANSLKFGAGTLVISVPPGDQWLRDRLAKAANRKVMEGALAQTFGAAAGWKMVEESPAPEVPQRAAATTESEALDDPRVQTVLEIFGGTVQSVEPVNDN